MNEIKEEEIIKALIQADDIAISEEVDCYDVLNYIEDLRSKYEGLVAHNAICTLLDATRKLLEQGSSKDGVWIKTGDLNDTYSILIQKEGLGRPIDALNAKMDSLSVELGQAKAYIGGLESELTNAIAAKEAAERDKANLERTIEEIYEALHAQGITLDCDGNVVPANKTINKYERLTPKDKIEVINVNHGDDMTRLMLYALKLWELENMLESGELIEVGQKERRGE